MFADQFQFSTVYSKSGDRNAGLKDQWKRKTILPLANKQQFFGVVTRYLVDSAAIVLCRHSLLLVLISIPICTYRQLRIDLTPIQNAIETITTRNKSMMETIQRVEGDTSDTPDLNPLQMALQGSVLLR